MQSDCAFWSAKFPCCRLISWILILILIMNSSSRTLIRLVQALSPLIWGGAKQMPDSDLIWFDLIWFDLINLCAVWCRYFPPGPRLPPNLRDSVTAFWPVPNYTAWRQRREYKRLAQSCHLTAKRRESNPQHVCYKSDAIIITPSSHT